MHEFYKRVYHINSSTGLNQVKKMNNKTMPTDNGQCAPQKNTNVNIIHADLDLLHVVFWSLPPSPCPRQSNTQMTKNDIICTSSAHRDSRRPRGFHFRPGQLPDEVVNFLGGVGEFYCKIPRGIILKIKYTSRNLFFSCFWFCFCCYKTVAKLLPLVCAPIM